MNEDHIETIVVNWFHLTKLGKDRTLFISLQRHYAAKINVNGHCKRNP